MDNYKVSKFLFLIIVTITCLLEFLSNFFGPYIKFVDDIIILFLIIYLTPRNLNNFDNHSVSLTRLVIFFFVISLFSGLINFEIFNLKPYLIQLKNYFFTFAVFLFAIFLYNESYFKLIIKIYLLVSLILALVGILEYSFKYHFFITYTPFGDLMAINPFRSYSLIGNPVDFAFYLIVPFLISLFSKRYLLSIFFLLAISTTLSLGNFSIILVLSIISFFLKILEKKIFIIILIILTVFTFNNDFVKNRISGKLEVAKFSPLDEEASRFNFYIQSSDVIKDNFLFGVGAGNFGGWVSDKNNPVYQKYNFKFYSLKSIDIFYPHLFGELGIFGLMIFLTIYLKIILKLFIISKYFSSNKNSHGYIISTTTFLYGITLIYSGFWSMFLETSFATIIFYFLSGYTYKYYKNVRL